MSYDLLLRGKDPASALAEPALASALRAAGGEPAEEGGWSLRAGGGRIAAALARSEGKLVGIELSIPFGAPEPDFRAAVLLAAELGARLQLALVDPQLGAEVTPSRAEESIERWRLASRYALGTGLVEDGRRALPCDPPRNRSSTKLRLAAAALLLLVGACLLFSWLIAAIAAAPKPID